MAQRARLPGARAVRGLTAALPPVFLAGAGLGLWSWGLLRAVASSEMEAPRRQTGSAPAAGPRYAPAASIRGDGRGHSTPTVSTRRDGPAPPRQRQPAASAWLRPGAAAQLRICERESRRGVRRGGEVAAGRERGRRGGELGFGLGEGLAGWWEGVFENNFGWFLQK